MKIKQVREMSGALGQNKHDYMTVSVSEKDGKRERSIKEVRSISILPAVSTLFEKAKRGRDFELSDKEAEFLQDAIPNNFSDFVYYQGNFYFVNFNQKAAKSFKTSDINFDKVAVFDLSRAMDSLISFRNSVRVAGDILENAIQEYDDSCVYDPNNYTILKEVEKEVSDKYDPGYSLTKEQTSAMRKWQAEHLKKFHKGLSKERRGSAPMSPFKVEFEACTIGDWAECVCTECLKAAEKETGKKREKLERQARYSIFDNMY